MTSSRFDPRGDDGVRAGRVKVLVTGSTGNVGRHVVTALAARGVPVRLADRAHVGPPSADRVRLDLADPATYAGATRGCSAVFLLRPPAISDTRRTLVPFIDAARADGATHVVFLSVAGAEKNALVPHHAVEQHLLHGPPTWTLLRPGFFAQNLADAYRADIRDEDRLYVPAGDGAVTFVDTRDLADVAADALAATAEANPHAGKAYTLTGPEAVTFATVAARLDAALGRRIRYEPASIFGYARHLRSRRGLPIAQIAVQTVLHVGLRFGQAATVDPTLAALLGRRPRTIDDFIRDHVDLWRR